MHLDLSAVDAALQTWIDGDHLPGVSYAVLHRGDVVAQRCLGWADREAGVPLREDHLFRIFSNTKLVTSCAALRLVEQGRFGLDDPVGEHLPALADLRVLRDGSSDLDDTVPAQEPVRVRHLLTHTAGFTYAFLEPDSPLGQAYVRDGLTDPAVDLAGMVDALGRLPLLFEPGSRWNYSVATDVLGRLIEVSSGERLDEHFRRHVFEPLGLRDTAFTVPPSQARRLAALYIGDLSSPLRPGLRRADHLPYEGAYLTPVARLNGGGGLVSTLADFASLAGTLMKGGDPLLRPGTLPLVLDNQLPPGQWLQFPGQPLQRGMGHSHAGSVRVVEDASDPTSRAGELQWGGLAGTQWFISPREQMGAVLMTQRYMGVGLPFWPEFKQGLRDAFARTQ